MQPRPCCVLCFTLAPLRQNKSAGAHLPGYKAFSATRIETSRYANRRGVGQNNASINIRCIAFASRNLRLIDEQFQFTANFRASQVVGNGLLHRHRRSIT